MPSKLSWNWLPSRTVAKDLIDSVAAAGASPQRPCLPAIEQLDDRVMLSVAGPNDPLPPPNTDPTQILIGLLKGELNLIKSELQVLKLAEGADAKISTIKLLTNSFLKLDDSIFKLSEAVLIGDHKLGDIKLDTQKLLNKIDEVLVKVDSLVAEVPDEKLLLPAVQKVREAASRMILGLGQLPTDSIWDKSHKFVIKLVDEFFKIDELLFKFGANLDGAQYQKGMDPAHKLADFFKIEIEGLKLDPELQQILLPIISDIKIETLNFLGSLLKPIPDGDLSSIGQFDGGIVLPDKTDDVIG